MNYYDNSTQTLTWNLTKVGDYPFQADFLDPAIDAIQQYINANDSGELDDWPAGTYTSTNLTYLCLATLDNTPFDSDGAPTDYYFGNNLFNVCSVYPNMTYDIQYDHDKLIDTPFDKGFVKNLALYDIIGKKRYDAAVNITDGVFNVLNTTCDNILCDGDKSGVCSLDSIFVQSNSSIPDDLLNGDYPDLLPLSHDGLQACQKAICTKSLALLTSNSDIGGVGVYVSYVITLILMGLIAAHMLHNLIRQHAPKRFRARLGPTHTSEAFTEFVINFLKLVVFFLAVIMIATFITIKPDSLSYPDYLLLVTLSLNGMVVIVATTLAVQYYGKGNWFLVTQAFVAYMLSAVLFGLALTAKFQPNVNFVNSFTGLNLCSHIFDDMQQTEGTLEFVAKSLLGGGNTKLIVTFVWTLIMMILVLVYQMSDFLAKQWVVGNPFHWSNETRTKKRVMIAAKGVAALTFCLVYAYQIYLLYQFHLVVTFTKDSFTFGQIVALFLAVPLLIDFVYERILEFREDRKEKHMSEAQYEDVPQKGSGSPQPQSTVHMQEVDTSYSHV